MRAAPYSLVLGDSVYAIITARNNWGTSAPSVPGNGAIVVMTPSAPVTLANVAAVTSDMIIGFTWNDGPTTGGSSIIDYRISYDRASGDGTFVTLATGVKAQAYNTTIAL